MSSKPTVVFVDDNPGDARLLDIVLRQQQNNLVLRYYIDGAAARHYFSTIRSFAEIPNLIILDMDVPKSNGIELLQGLRSNEYLEQVPV